MVNIESVNYGGVLNFLSLEFLHSKFLSVYLLQTWVIFKFEVDDPIYFYCLQGKQSLKYHEILRLKDTHLMTSCTTHKVIVIKS